MEATPEQLNKIKALYLIKNGIELNDEQSVQLYMTLYLRGRAMARFFLIQEGKNEPESIE